MIWRIYQRILCSFPVPSSRPHVPLGYPSSSGYRHASSSGSPGTLLDPRLERFQAAVRTGSLRQIKSAYDHLRTYLLANTSQSHLSVDEDTFTKAMGILSKSSIKNEINTVFVMFADLTSLFNRQPGKEHRLAVLQAMISRGWQAQALLRLREAYNDPEECALVMAAFQQLGQEETALNIFTESVRAGVNPNSSMYRILLLSSEQLKDPGKLQKFSGVMHDYLSRRVGRIAFNDTFWTALVPLLATDQQRLSKQAAGENIGNVSNGVSTCAPYSAVNEPSEPQTVSSVAERVVDAGSDTTLREVQTILHNRGFSSALQFLETQQKRGIRISGRTVDKLASSVSKTSELRELSEKFGLVLNADRWTSLIVNAGASKGFPAARAVFQDAKESGIQPMHVMAIPLFRQLGEGRIRSANDARLKEAVDLYRDVLDMYPPDTAQEMLHAHAGSWTKFYEHFLSLFANSADAESAFPVVVMAFNDMAQHGISFDVSTATSMTILLMRNSPSHEAAYEICAIFQEHYGNVLDVRASEAVLGAFSKLSFPHQPFTPPSLFFMLLNNMQRTGFQLSMRAYTTILSHISRTCSHSEAPARAADTVRQIHKRLLLDTTLTPDTPLLNALMNAYNHAGSPVEAIRVWESLYLQGKHDNASLSIVLDTLSHAGATQQAARIMSKIHKAGFQLDRNNWQSWLELLCRAKKFEQATNLLYYDMRQANPPMVPDQEHIGTLLKYSWDSGMRREIQSRIRRYWPSIWSSLPEDMKA